SVLLEPNRRARWYSLCVASASGSSTTRTEQARPLVPRRDEAFFIDSPDFDAPKRGQQAIRETYSKYFRQTPDIRDDVKSIVACGDKVFVEFVSSGTIENPPSYAPPQMKGKKFAVKMASVLEIKNGKIVRDVTYYNQLSFLKQIGAM
ncbi:MAG: nuclear transport factor 2 family protein, partial [Acidobacteriota bacterium]|nr:nuclear transport factor 2 family protein [Acidobacteriota bacterium]